jgi:uncharacterized membrane-anchored protein YhcB (DUF1043 family)
MRVCLWGFVNNDYQTQQILIQRQIEEAKTILKRYSEEAMSHGVTQNLITKLAKRVISCVKLLKIGVQI